MAAATTSEWPWTEFLLIRHGQTTWNAAGIMQGQADAPLDAVGIAQAQALGKHLAGDAYAGIDVVASSDLARASDTARAIATEIGVPADDVTLHPEMRERHMGSLQGKSREGTEGETAKIWNAFQRSSNDDDWRVPGGRAFKLVP
jgi:probable phosphoglycerate mutase